MQCHPLYEHYEQTMNIFECKKWNICWIKSPRVSRVTRYTRAKLSECNSFTAPYTGTCASADIHRPGLSNADYCSGAQHLDSTFSTFSI